MLAGMALSGGEPARGGVEALPEPVEALPVDLTAEVPVPGHAVASDPRLLAWYPCDEDFVAARQLTDRSRFGDRARLHGRVRRVDGALGAAASFAGDGFFEAGGNVTADRRRWSISLWLRTAEPKHDGKMISCALWDPSRGAGWQLGLLYPELWGAKGGGIVAGGGIVPGRMREFAPDLWNHLVLTHDADTANVREYLNGLMVQDFVTGGEPPAPGAAIAIGGWKQWPAHNFRGDLDEIRIYDGVLSETEIADLYGQVDPAIRAPSPGLHQPTPVAPGH